MAVKTPPRSRSRGRGKPTRRRPKKRGVIRRYWWVLVVFPLVCAGAAFGALAYVYSGLAVPDAPPLLQSSRLLDRDGKLITTFHAEVDRKVVRPDQIAKPLKEAVVAAEDKDFYEHGGVSPIAIVRAALADASSGEFVEGGSTITQQYVKNVYTGSERTFRRKIEEAMLAVKLDHEYEKDEILTKYLNTIYFGHGAYGVEAAAQTYWGVHASQLNLAQSATLAGLIAAPSAYDPILHPDEARTRRDYVLDRMVEDGLIPQPDADAVKAKRVHTVKHGVENSEAAYFADYARRALEPLYPGGELTGGGLRITSTLDLDLQRAAENSVARYLPGSGDPDAALVAIDPRNGGILAMVGGRDFSRSQVNLATGDGTDGRQAGSAFKPFTLAAALEAGYSPESVWNGPQSIPIDDSRCANPDGTPWEVSNAADGEAGSFSLFDATAYSVNTVFAQLVVADDIGPERVAQVARRMGITSRLDPVCSITLGTNLVTPLEMTAAYATLASRGEYHEPTPIKEVKGPDGATLPEPRQRSRPDALRPNDADVVTNALEGVVTSGTGTAAALDDRDVAGKTGTTQDYKNAWFCGYTPELATCVWVGHVKREKPMTWEGGPMFGGTAPALIWHDFMTDAVQITREPVAEFPRGDISGYERGTAETPVAPGTEPSPRNHDRPRDEVTEAPPPTEEPPPTEDPPPSP